MKLTTQDLLAKARWQAAKRVPYLARSLWAMRFVVTDRVPTCAVDDQWRVYVNPAYAEKCMANDTLVGELLHECLHPTLRHRQRALTIRATNHRRWNACGDAELDQHIEAAGVKLVDDRVRPQALGGDRGMTAEELYRLPHPDGQGRCSGGSGTGLSSHECEKEGKKIPGIRDTEADIVRAVVAQEIQKYAKSAPGSVPAGLLRWAEQWGQPAPVDWTALVSARLQYALDTRPGPNPSYARPSRRSIPGGGILPVYRLPLPKLALVLDTSGSMDEDEIGQGLACAYDACQVLGRVWAIACDARAGDPAEICHVDELREHLRGGGGTDMREGITRALEIDPDAIVVVSDGESAWPDVDPQVPVTVVLTEPDYAGMIPAWAELVPVPHD